MINNDRILLNNSLSAPVITQDSWRFAGLSAATLLPLLQQHLVIHNATANWQLVWLNNNGRPVIGLLPKVSWSMHFCPEQDETDSPAQNNAKRYKVVKTYREPSVNSADDKTTYMSYSEWQNELIAYSKSHETQDDLTQQADNKDTYQHGLIGFIGYDIAACELSPLAGIDQASQPRAVLGHYDIYLTSMNSNVENGWQLNVRISNSNSNNQATASLLTMLTSALDSLDKQLSEQEEERSYQPKLTPLVLIEQWQKCDYSQAFEQTQQYLKQGDCYQINLTQAWQGYLHNSNDDKSAHKLLDYLPSLHANTQAPFAGYLENVDFELLSCSPELFFTFIKRANTHHIITKPIKGTVPRGSHNEQDLQFKQRLLDSDKDRAENLMIVDLLRNDLGKYAKIGSVKVPQLFAIESFSNVHHMVSTITAELRYDIHPLAVLFGSLPAGSITGTPKKRAVEIIAELENEPRGAYCGTMGYMNFDGSGQWNVLIRTLQANESSNGIKKVSLWAGGGITIASDCAAEYQECLDKVGNLLGVLANK